jgi:hypothetical protein
MPQTHEYKMIVGTPTNSAESQLSTEGRGSWKPILMSTIAELGGTFIYIVLSGPLPTEPKTSSRMLSSQRA